MSVYRVDVTGKDWVEKEERRRARTVGNIVGTEERNALTAGDRPEVCAVVGGTKVEESRGVCIVVEGGTIDGFSA